MLRVYSVHTVRKFIKRRNNSTTGYFFDPEAGSIYRTRKATIVERQHSTTVGNYRSNNIAALPYTLRCSLTV